MLLILKDISVSKKLSFNVNYVLSIDSSLANLLI